MLLSLNEVRGYEIRASDDSIGKASDFFFDDVLWNIRYLVIDTGWLFGRKVLVAPEAIQGVDIGRSEISVSLTKKEIEEGPGIGSDLPVSRQEEVALREHYGWPKYWEVYPAGMGAAPLIPPVQPREAMGKTAVSSAETDARERGDPNLRSAREVEGYHIEAKDGEIGHVEDFVLDDEFWAIRYVVVDTRNWLPGRKVLVAPGWAEEIDWAGRFLRVKLDREAVKDCPTYDPSSPIDRDYERAMHEYYGRKPYWA